MEAETQVATAAEPPQGVATAAGGDSGVVRSDSDHFVERAECLKCLEIVAAASIADHTERRVPMSPTAEACGQRPEEIAAARAVSILETYQEQSLLLDKHLEALVNVLMDAVKEVIRLREVDLEAAREGAETTSFPFQVYRNEGLQLTLKVLYTLCKVRGYKAVVKQLPHQVADLEPTLRLIQCQDPKDYATWETRYSLLLWMSMLVLIPFDLDTVDSGAGPGGASLVLSVTDICKGYLTDSGPCREAAAICLARLLTRPDMESTLLGDFLNWAGATLEAIAARREQDASLSSDAFLLTGVFQALTEVFKHGHREKLLDHIPVIFSRVLAASNRDGSQSSLERKLTMKLVQRVGLNFLPPKVVSWRYERGKRSLLQNMGAASSDASQGGDAPAPAPAEAEEDVDIPSDVEEVIEKLLGGLRDKDTIVRWSAAKGIGRITSRLPLELADDVVAFVLDLFDVSEGESAWHGGCLALAELARRGLLLPDRLGKVVPFVVQALVYDVQRGHNSVGANVRDAACYVCWAFARAYEPSVMAPHVAELCPQMLVTAVFDREVNCRRAASAAFQENVGRQGHENFPFGIEILTAADYFTLGVRSNAYLNIASFIAQFEMYRKPLVNHLVERKLAHWDLQLRMLSAEALHVLTGRDPAYLANAVLPELLPKTLSPDMLVRHGATLAVGEITTALAKARFQLGKSALADIRNTVMRIESARLYRGRGGEWMRVAACKLIRAIALSGHGLTLRAQKRLLESIEESMKHPKDEVKEAAVAALQALTEEGFGPDPKAEDGADSILVPGDEPRGVLDDAIELTPAQLAALSRPLMPHSLEPVRAEIVERIAGTYCGKLEDKDPNPSVRRGCALALGALPARIVAATPETLARVVDALILSTKLEEDADLRDAETRRNAVASLGKLVATVGVAIPGRPSALVRTALLSKDQIASIFEALFAACGDYETDNRGDVGSWVRAVAVTALLEVVRTVRSFPGRILHAERVPEDASRRVEIPALGLATVLRTIKASDGDVAWVRVDSDPEGVVRKLSLSAVEAKPANTTASASPNGGFTVPPEAERDALWVSDAAGKAMHAISRQAPIAELGEFQPTCLNDYLPAARCTRLVNCVLHQLCEKIGILRESAGTALREILRDADDPALGLPFTVPALGKLRAIFAADADGACNWKVEAYTFPKVAQVLGETEYLASAMSGLALSVGDLTESVSMNATAAFLGWCKDRHAHKAFPELTAMSNTLLAMLQDNAKCDRVVVPALKALDLVLESQVLTFRRSPKQHWLLAVHDAIKAEIKGSANVAKLMACSKVLFHLASFEGPVRPVALGSILILLGHKFPRVRMDCASGFNMWALALDGASVCGGGGGDDAAQAAAPQADDGEPTDMVSFMRDQLAEFERELAARPDAQRPEAEPGFDPEDAWDAVQDVIAETPWETISTRQAREQRDKLYPLLRIHKPAGAAARPAKRPEEEEAAAAAAQGEESYADLIHSAEMGYK